MFLSIATTHHPATDLGFLLMKHPDRLHQIDLSFGKAVVFFPQADENRCEATLIADIDPVALVRGKGQGDGILDQYVNDRPYAASSFLAVAINKAYRSAMAGTSKERPDLAATPIPLEIVVTPLPTRDCGNLVVNMFEALNWRVSLEPIIFANKPSDYSKLTLTGVARLADALSHLYVLIPVVDDQKHYWIGEDEIDKLMAKGGAWLADHPDRLVIAQKYLKKRSVMVREALTRLAPEESQAEASGEQLSNGLRPGWAPVRRLAEMRLDAVAESLAARRASTVADLGCGEGRLIQRLMRDRRISKVFGLDASAVALDRATERLKRDNYGTFPEDRVTLLHGALTYRDERWKDVDAAVLIEVIEHMDLDRLPALEANVFGHAQPKTVIVTTPNIEFNVLYGSLGAGALRNSDHRFEWTREEFSSWANGVATQYGYEVTTSEIGGDEIIPAHPVYGAPTQIAVFTK